MQTLTSDELYAALRTLVAKGLTFGHCTDAFRPSSEDELAYVQQAEAQDHHDGELEIPSNAVVSLGDNGGAYVMAWVWVSDKDIWKGETDDEGEPCRCINHYTCEECDESWTDQWSCACNDRCPTCDHEIEPHETVELNLHGDVVQLETV